MSDTTRATAEEIERFVALLRQHPEMRDAIKRILTEPEDEAHG